LTLYLDASALIPLFITESRTLDAESALRGRVPVVSDLAIAEFSAGIARRFRMRDIREADALTVFSNFDAWVASARRETVTAEDLLTAITLVRRFDLGLCTPDALNLAIATRCNASVLTFDDHMARAARSLDLEVLGA
jgi:predicted nucleic acid-binding protein